MNLECLHNHQPEIWQAPGKTTPVQLDEITGVDTAEYALLQGAVAVPDLSKIKAIADDLYRQLLVLASQLGKPRFVRIWNYIPEINEGTGDHECYRQFCWGRADALGNTVLPAATGIGSHDGVLRISALTTRPATPGPGIDVHHIENPRQLSAYNYPRNYGPKSPSFARATLVEPPNSEPGAGLLLLSGTASIVNHESRHPHDLALQSKETARNIHALLATLKRPVEPLFLRYYLRDPSRLEEAIAAWPEHFGDWALPAFYRGDICRSELELEVEGVFRV